MKRHYVYELKFDNGMKYLGVRTCDGDPEEDSYKGSSSIITKEQLATCKKVILSEHPTRNEAVLEEVRLHDLYDVSTNKKYYNLVKQTNTKFDQQGCTAETHAHIAAMAHKLTGRKEEDYDYIVRANEKRKAYVGENRTAAQVAGSKIQAESVRGTKCPAKGKSGVENQGFIPWYYITPEGTYTEVHDQTKEEFSRDKPFSYRQLGHRFHHTNMHKEGRYKLFKGWTFGNLPRPLT